MREEEPQMCSFSWRPQHQQHQSRLLRAFFRQVLEIPKDGNGTAFTENVLQSLALLTREKCPCPEPLVFLHPLPPPSVLTTSPLPAAAARPTLKPLLSPYGKTPPPQCPPKWQVPSRLDGPWLNSLLFVPVSLVLGGGVGAKPDKNSRCGLTSAA